jgi:hypothetical protein
MSTATASATRMILSAAPMFLTIFPSSITIEHSNQTNDIYHIYATALYLDLFSMLSWSNVFVDGHGIVKLLQVLAGDG